MSHFLFFNHKIKRNKNKTANPIFMSQEGVALVVNDWQPKHNLKIDIIIK
jgi:hypothetical protein